MGVTYNPFSLEGKTILVTGASSGIGRQTAIECSKMGAKVIVCGRNQERLNETLSSMEGEGHVLFTGDLLEEGVINQLVLEIPNVDGAVLAAGRGLTLPFQFSTREKFDEIFNINFFSNVELLRMLAKKKKINANGSVVVIVSIGGTKKFAPGNGIYGAAKAALNSMVHFAAIELAPKKVRVNGICPGMIDTPLIHRGTISDEQLKLDAENYPLKRYGKPEDVAMGAVYLLSEASSWVTGHSLVIDGGMTAK
jgi:NAD(P)-dependent dehydrogenase (short-subunit alcohol dehydrogenase family)